MATTVDRIHSKVTADTTQARRSMRQYGAAGKRAGASITAGFAKFGLAMAGVQSAIALVSSAFQNADFANEVERLREVVTDTFGKELAAATGGTVSQLEALQFGAKSMTGAFRLTREEMKMVLSQADDLAKRGFGTTAKIANELSEALNTGRVNSLAKYGVSVDRDLKQPAEKAAAVLAALHEQSKNPLANDEAKTNFDKFKSEMANATNAMKEFFGGIVRDITLAGAAAINAFKTIARLTDSDEQSARIREVQMLALIRAKRAAERQFGETGRADPTRILPLLPSELVELKQREVFIDRARIRIQKEIWGEQKKEREGLAALKIAESVEEAERILAARQKVIAEERKKRKRSGATEDGGTFVGAEGTISDLLAESETFERRMEHLIALGEARKAALENQEEMDKKSAESQKKLADIEKLIADEKIAAREKSIEGLASSAESMIAIGETLFGKSKALEVLNAVVMVAKETALAASSFATGNIPGGIAHVAAGVSWGAVAVKAGGSAGGGKSSGGASRGAAGGGSLTRGSGGGGQTTILVTVNAGIGTQPDEIAVAINNGIRTAERRGSIQPREQSVVQFA